jgi:acyl-coenzyme A synthetase/AMP-(fatty) acid ligase
LSGQAYNIGSLVTEAARKAPSKTAVFVPVKDGPDGAVIHRSWTFGELDGECDRLAHGLKSLGVCDGARALLMVMPGFEFIALAFALFKTGAVPVMIDPGVGRHNLLDCIARAEPEALIGVPKAHMARVLFPRYFRSVKTSVTVGRRWLWGGYSFDQIRARTDAPFPTAATTLTDTAAILFTTGSTGAPKGVVYEHGVFKAQVDLIQSHYGITENDVDMPAFPLFALFSVGMGMSVVIPKLDPSSPADADPAKIVAAIREKSVTFTFGSPAIWRKVSAYCHDNKITLPSLKKVLMAGAPVREEIHRLLLGAVLPEGALTHTPFGATEALPVCDMTGAEVLAETAQMTRVGRGYCVGRALPGIGVEIIGINDGPIETWDESLKAPAGEPGEIVVSGPVVTKEYFRLPEQTKLAKIRDAKTGVIRHRMGDVGYIDEKGRLWFLGRKSHRVVTEDGTLFTIAVEAIFNNHPDVFRSALVGIGSPPRQSPMIIIELNENASRRDEKKIAEELLDMAAKSPVAGAIKRFLFHPSFPTDARHNAKIFREKLKAWAESKLSGAYGKG